MLQCTQDIACPRHLSFPADSKYGRYSIERLIDQCKAQAIGCPHGLMQVQVVGDDDGVANANNLPARGSTRAECMVDMSMDLSSSTIKVNSPFTSLKPRHRLGTRYRLAEFNCCTATRIAMTSPPVKFN